MASCNTTLEDSHIVEEALWKGFTFHHFGLFLCVIFGLISVFISLWLIFMHALHYLRPSEQKHIIRIVFMIPVYSVVSFLSYLFYRQSIYFEVVRDCYEAFAISSFFALLCHYIAPTLHDQKDYFRTVTPKNWVMAVFGLQKCTGGQNKGPLRRPRSGLTWFNVIWAGIFQYCFIRVFFTIVSVVSEAFGRYCSASLSPAFAHIWVQIFEALGVTIAMFFVIQFYVQLKEDLAEHRPFLKVVSIKLVIFFSFWQTIVISFLSSANGPLQPTKHLAAQDIQIGIPSVLLCVEMAIFSVLHIFAYPWKPYSIKHMSSDPLMAPGIGYSGNVPKYQGGPLGIKAILDAFNPWDIIKAFARGIRWLFVGVKRRHEDISYQPKKLGTDNTSYLGPSFAATGETATELSKQDRRGRTNEPFDDRAGLLSNTQLPPRMNSTSPYRTDDADDFGEGDIGTSLHPARTASPMSPMVGGDLKPSELDDEPGFHPGMGPPPGSAITTGPSGSVHPAHRYPGQRHQQRFAAPTRPQQQQQDWDVFGGSQQRQQRDSDAASDRRPPTYRTHDPYG